MAFKVHYAGLISSQVGPLAFYTVHKGDTSGGTYVIVHLFNRSMSLRTMMCVSLRCFSVLLVRRKPECGWNTSRYISLHYKDVQLHTVNSEAGTNVTYMRMKHMDWGSNAPVLHCPVCINTSRFMTLVRRFDYPMVAVFSGIERVRYSWLLLVLKYCCQWRSQVTNDGQTLYTFFFCCCCCCCCCCCFLVSVGSGCWQRPSVLNQK